MLWSICTRWFAYLVDRRVLMTVCWGKVKVVICT